MVEAQRLLERRDDHYFTAHRVTEVHSRIEAEPADVVRLTLRVRSPLA